MYREEEATENLFNNSSTNDNKFVEILKTTFMSGDPRSVVNKTQVLSGSFLNTKFLGF